jgi:hypothetical protein
MYRIDVKQANVFANRCGRHLVISVVELKRTQGLILNVVAKNHVETPRASKASGRATAAAEKFSQSVFIGIHEQIVFFAAFHRSSEVDFVSVGIFALNIVPTSHKL